MILRIWVEISDRVLYSRTWHSTLDMANNICIIKLGKANGLERRDIMFFWKIDDETIRCLINKEEIGQMGFDLNELSSDNDLMEEFLNAIIANSKNYINWNTDNGVQNYIARALPSEQFLITISCTFQDVAIDRDLDQIKKMTTALRERISDDRIDSIYSMSGEEKEREFEALAKDLHDVCMGNTTEKEEQEEKKSNLENLSDEDFDLMLEEMLKERKERKRKREKDFEM